MCEICSKSTIKTPQRCCFHCWLWTSKCRLGRNQTRTLLPVLHFIKKSTRNKKIILYIQKCKCKHIFFASQMRAQEFITHRNKNENKKTAIDPCTFSNPNLSVIWQYWALTKKCKTSMKTPMMESLFGQIAGCKLSTWSFILKITTTDIFLGIFQKSSELHLFILF